jgi:NLI interacting factor-like phosphatase
MGSCFSRNNSNNRNNNAYINSERCIRVAPINTTIPPITRPIPIKQVSPLIPKADSKYAKSMTIVLDLDETLVAAKPWNMKRESEIPARNYQVFIRPYALELIYTLKALNMEIIIWSAGLKYYVLSTLSFLLLGRLELIDHIIWRDTRWHPKDAIKTVPKDLNFLGRDMSRLLFIDNHPANMEINPLNSILISHFDYNVIRKQMYDERSEEERKKGIDYSICNELVTHDASFLALITTLHWINQIRLNDKTSISQPRDVRDILSDELIGKFIRKWECDDSGCYDCDQWYYYLLNVDNDAYLELLNDEDTTDLHDGDNRLNLTRFKPDDYRLICDTLQILIPKEKILQRMVENFEPLSPIRSHLTINPYLLERRYELIRYHACAHYALNPYYDSEYSKIQSNRYADYSKMIQAKIDSSRAYGTF